MNLKVGNSLSMSVNGRGISRPFFDAARPLLPFSKSSPQDVACTRFRSWPAIHIDRSHVFILMPSFVSPRLEG
jgi:hypothetical protein